MMVPLVREGSNTFDKILRISFACMTIKETSRRELGHERRGEITLASRRKTWSVSEDQR
ncbi:hypothetical protein JHK84_034906 [Glycine max]|nr:hypothetical protein JHK86_034645 [Glycine max]KAG5141138.1 hypothetical protein JHK84_034906 [Glycine max]